MRILILNYEFPPVGGGGGRVAEQICCSLAKLGHSVRVQTALWKGLAKVEEKDGYTIYRSWSARRHAHTCSVPEMVAFVLTNLAPSLKHALFWKPDIIHAHFAVPTGALAWMVSVLTGIPYVLSTQLGDVPGAIPDQTDHLFKLVKPFTVPIWRRAAMVTAPSDHIRELALRSYNVTIADVPNPIDLTSVKPSPPRPHEPKRMIFAGRFNPQKNLLFMAEVLERVSDLDWQMEMLGDGPLMEQVKAKIHQAGIADRVRFYGWVDPNAVSEAMSRSDILFLPSLSEGMPVVGAMALGTGLAIVGSDVGGIDLLVRNGENGFLCPVNDLESFEKALREILTSDDHLTRMKIRSRTLAKDFAVEAIAERFEDIFEAALD